jgi:hypothetical protein
MSTPRQFNRDIDFLSTIDSTNSSTGSVRIDGGIGIIKNANFGQNVNISSGLTAGNIFTPNLSVTTATIPNIIHTNVTTGTLIVSSASNLSGNSNTIGSVIFTTGGNVGINTTSPSTTLYVNGNTFLNGNVTMGNYLWLTNFTASNIITNNVNYGISNTFSGSFAVANNVSVAANVTGLSFSNSAVRFFKADVSVSLVSSTGGSYQVFTFEGTQNTAGWSLYQSNVGDISGLSFSITAAGQIQYTSTNVVNWTSNTIRFSVSQITASGTYQSLLNPTVGSYIINSVQLNTSDIAVAGTNTGALYSLGGVSIGQNIQVYSTSNATAIGSGGSATILGGAAISKDLIVGGNLTTGTILSTGLTTGNINFTGSLFQNGVAYLGSQWTSTGANIFFGTSGSSNVGINTTSPAFNLDVNGSMRSTAVYTTNITSTNLVSTTSTLPNLITTNITTSTLLASTSVSTSTLLATTSTIPNIIHTNITTSTLLASTSISTGTLLATTSTIPNSTFTNITTSTLLASTSVSTGTLLATTSTIPNIIHTNITTSSINSTGLISTASLFSTTATIPNSTFTNITTSTLLASTSISTGALLTTTSTIPNSTFTNITTSTLLATTLLNIVNTTATSMGILIVAGPGSSTYLPATTTSGQLASFYGPGGAIISNIDLSTYVPNTGTNFLPSVRFSMLDLGSANSSFNILTKNSGATGTMATRIMIDGSGNVGINTTSPTFTLDVSGTSRITTSLTTGAVYSTNITSTNIVGTTITSSGLWVTNSITTPSILASTNISSAALYSTNITSTNVVSTSISAANIIASTNISSAAVYSTNITSTNIVGTLISSGANIISGGGLIATFNSNTLGNIFTSGGNVGINTTSPATNTYLTINGGNQNFNVSQASIAFSYAPSTGFYHFLSSRHNASVSSNQNSIDFFLNNSATQTGSTAPNFGNVNSLSVTAIGVGIFNSGPISALTVNPLVIDAASFDHSISPLTVTQNSSSGTSVLNDQKPVLHLTRQGKSSQSFGQRSTFALSRYENNGTNSRTRLDIGLSQNSYDTIYVMSVRGDGNVGINNTAPAFNFDVTGTLNASASITTGAVYSTNITSTNLVSTTSTIPNSIFTNITTSSLYATGNTTLGNLYMTNLTVGNVITGNVNYGIANTFSGSFSASNNVIVATAVTGLSFASAAQVAFTANIAVSISATTSLFSQYILEGIQTSSGWNMSVSSVGDTTGITFTINSSTGQVNYTSTNITGFVSSTFRWKVSQISSTGTYTSLLGNTAGSYILGSLQLTTTSGAAFVNAGSITSTFNSNTIGNIYTTGGNIGINTTAPSTTLHIIGSNVGGVSTITSGSANIRIQGGGSSQAPPTIIFDTFSSGFSASGNQITRIAAADNGSSGADLFFLTNNTTRQTILNNGNVGIGITAPAYTLDVAGTARISTSLTTGAVYTTNITSANLVSTLISSGAHIISAGGLIATFNSNTIGNIYTTNGNVGIGTTSPAYTLDVNGIARFSTGLSTGTLYSSASNTGDIRVNNTSLITGTSAIIQATGVAGVRCAIGTYMNSSTSQNHIEFCNSNGFVGAIQTVNSSTVYSTSSDYRLKENIITYVDGLDTINKLQPVSYNFKTDKDIRTIGFVAHEIQQYIPEAVIGKKDQVNDDGSIKPQTVDYGRLTPYLTSAIQQLHKKLNEQQMMINLLLQKLNT